MTAKNFYVIICAIAAIALASCADPSALTRPSEKNTLDKQIQPAQSDSIDTENIAGMSVEGTDKSIGIVSTEDTTPYAVCSVVDTIVIIVILKDSTGHFAPMAHLTSVTIYDAIG